MVLFIGSLGFFCYFLYDINSVLWQNRLLQKLFLAGSLCITGITLYMLYQYPPDPAAGKFRFALCTVSGFLFFLLLVYTLFFALPFETTYVGSSQKRNAYTEGVYGLCRHPGVLWFAGLYISLAAIVSRPAFWLMAAVLIGWNTMYVVFQDIWTFPRTFTNYKAYQNSTPFLIPTGSSIRFCFHTLRKTKTTQ